ncbi:MAG: hypothetical protein R3B74_00245 [Nitrospirales bacterium]|nr:hypothetical protein [Nitrospirales bacterium]
MPGPHSGDHHMRKPEGLRQPSGAPVGRPIRRPAPGPLQNPRFQFGGEDRGGLTPVPAVEPRQPLGGKALTPAGDIRIAAVEAPTDLGPAGSLSE